MFELLLELFEDVVLLEVDVEPVAAAIDVPATFIWLELSALVRVWPLNWKFPATNAPVSIALSCKLVVLSTFSTILKWPLPSTSSIPIGLLPDNTSIAWFGVKPPPVISIS